MTTHDKLKILLLQIRDEIRVRQEELASFARYADLGIEQFDVLNVFDQPEFPLSIVDGYDALFVGGASEASVLEPDQYPFLQSCQTLLSHCIAINKPVFASCFGFQLAIKALQGDIIHDSLHYEMGVIPIELTETAQSDPLFHDTPNHFLAVSVHQEKALAVPACCEILAKTKQCIHAFRVKDKPFWAFQFHPEVDKATLIERLTIYKKKYTKDDNHLNQVIENAKETPESNQLMKKFVDRILLPSHPI